MRLRLMGLAAIVALASAGCELLEDATSFSVCTDEDQFKIDSSQVGLALPTGVNSLPAIPCTQDAACVQNSSPISCGAGDYPCRIYCGSSGNCEVEATFTHHVDIDLSTKIKSQLQAAAIDKVTLDKVKYTVTENTLNFDTPEIELHVGPSTAAEVGSQTTLFATVPVIAQKMEPRGDLEPTAAGQKALNGFVKDYKTPFRILGAAKIVIPSGTGLPSGALTTTVQTCFKISLL